MGYRECDFIAPQAQLYIREESSSLRRQTASKEMLKESNRNGMQKTSSMAGQLRIPLPEIILDLLMLPSNSGL